MRWMILLLCAVALASCAHAQQSKRYNVVLIMADDAGAECFNCYGGTSYSTPNIDAIAKRGIRFTDAHSQPICTPTRVKLMTGLSNGRNYIRFGMLDAEAYTFGNLMKDAGYTTAVVGKWQLWGRADEPFAHQGMHPTAAGFDEYFCWHLDKRLSRYWKPVLDKNGTYVDTTSDDYGPTLLADYAVDFIKRQKDSDKPFFLYYPMCLPHGPFEPTPMSKDRSNKNRQQNFADMVAYCDAVVGRIDQTLQEQGLSEDTLLIFTADNGTDRMIKSEANGKTIQGSKGLTINYGTHVPMVAVGGPVKGGRECGDLIDFADFYATLIAVSGTKFTEAPVLDGRSFLPQLMGEKGDARGYLYCYYNARPTVPNWNLGSHRFVYDKRFKLYADGRFFDIQNDPLEQSPIDEKLMSDMQLRARDYFQDVLNKSPQDPPKLAKPKQQ